MHYKDTFLKQVILRFDYARLAALLTDQETGFTLAMRERYPDVSAQPATMFQVLGGPIGPSISSAGMGWLRIHKTAEPNRSVTLAPEFLAMEYTGPKAYENFIELRSQLSVVLGSFREHFGPVQFSRIGLRYINEFIFPTGDALDWDGLLDPSLVTSVKAGMFDGLRMTRSAHQLVARRGDVAVTLNYGINNPDFPNPVVRRQFVLDLDCYISGVIEFTEADQRVKDVNALAEAVFEHSITEDLRAKMGILKDDRTQ